MKGWVLAPVQVLLVIVGAYYIYQAMITLSYGVESIEMSASFMSSMMVGVILLGLAVLLQGIHQCGRGRL